MKHPLSDVFDAILRELRNNPDFRERIDQVLVGKAPKTQKSRVGK